MKLLFWALILGLFGSRGLAQGEAAPMLKVQDSYGKPVDFAALTKAGDYVLLWFYPKAKSPGCTAQGKRYTDLYDEFKRLNVAVFGVSHDPSAEQCDFIEKLALKGGMLPDRDGAIAKAFGVGGLFGFYNRDTVLINPQGKIERVWRGVNPFKDADTVLQYVKDKAG
ncbi:MAG: peroxiredoxin, partial [Meiothermus sp.]